VLIYSGRVVGPEEPFDSDGGLERSFEVRCEARRDHTEGDTSNKRVR